MKRNSLRLFALCACILPLAACNFPDRRVDDDTVVTPSEDDQPAQETAPTTASPTAGAPDQDADPTPASFGPSAPEGWEPYADSNLGIELYIPPGWEPITINENKLDIRETDGFAWLEINQITSETAIEWSVAYSPGTSAEAIIGELAAAAQSDGDFDAPYELTAPGGLPAWATQGHYDVLNEPVIIGAIDLSDRLLLTVGHALESDDWTGIYLPLYESLIQTITSAS